jgi:putative membrane protein
MMRHWNGGGGGGWGAGYWLLMSFAMVLVWALLVAAVVLAVRYAGRRTTGGRPPAGPDGTGARPRTARDILDERYARGEIGDEEYRNRRDTLASE